MGLALGLLCVDCGMLGILPAVTAMLRASIQACGIALESGVSAGYAAAQVEEPTSGKAEG